MRNNKGITLSEKHGVNPSLILCPYCGKETGIALFGKLEGDKEAPRNVVGDDLCDECKKKVEDGLVLIIEAEQTSDGIKFLRRRAEISKEFISDNVDVSRGFVFADSDIFDAIEKETESNS